MKRGTSGYSFVFGLDKPSGYTSHDMVNIVRHRLGEGRVGHTGTLDPLASGALLVCVGAATRLDRFLTAERKTYEVAIRFGLGTTTDDAQGEICRRAKPAPELFKEEVARAYLRTLIGKHQQVPPVYSAVKVQGVRSYAAARKGNVVELHPRPIEIFDATLLKIEEAPDAFDPIWQVRFCVSKGTYIRALARDAGNSLCCPAHVAALRRTACGTVSVDDCVSIDSFKEGRYRILDPVGLLGYRVLFCDEALGARVANGGFISAEKQNFFVPAPEHVVDECVCCAGIRPSSDALQDGEYVSLVCENTLKALYAFDASRALLRPACVFQQGVSRG